MADGSVKKRAKAKTTYGETTTKTSQTASSPATSQGSSEKAGPTVNAETTVTVTRVVDGDTLKISPAIEDIVDVRLIGVDIPETKKPNCASQSYGAEASAFTTTQLQGQQVGLEFDVEKADRYDRLLAYVYSSDGSLFSDTLLREGYAQLANFPPNVKYVERFQEFQEAQAKARAAGLGLWGQPPEQLAQQTDRGNGIGGEGCLEKAAQPQPQPVPAAHPDGDVDCSDFGSSADLHHMIICIHRLRNRGLIQHFLNDLGIDVLRQQEGCARVPQGMEGESGQPRILQERLELLVIEVVGCSELRSWSCSRPPHRAFKSPFLRTKEEFATAEDAGSDK